MQIKNLINDDAAVSPVIGVILMVAITVILAAVIGTFVLGLGDQVQETTPQVSVTFDYKDPTSGGDSLDIIHDGGDDVKASAISLVVNGATDGGTDITYNGDMWSGTGEVTAGDSATLDDTASYWGGTSPSDLQLDASSVRVVWSGESGDNSATLGKWEGPNA